LKLESPTSAAQWQAVLTRDASQDGRFVFAVTTTGIYCRPSCPARRPLQKNTRFFPTPACAERAGFRPCKRCQPHAQSQTQSLEQRHTDAITRACRLIDSSDDLPTLDQLAQYAGLSRFHFHRTFKHLTGLTPKAFARARRAEKLRQTLPSAATVTDALFTAGYPSGGRFYSESNHILGMKPKHYQKGAPGLTLRHALGTSTLGHVLAAFTDHGLCALLLGDDPIELLADLRRRFPKASHLQATAADTTHLASLIAYIEAPATATRPDLPLDIRGTAFQQRVWTALQSLPFGTTTSYSALAAQIDAPTATRAVATACAANPIAVLIPCHRVLRADSSLAGYRWGLLRKQSLLAKEQSPALPHTST
jgi:AraC family transcriptional regulator of adaptative response/methylated-DNA-[protein]-cysteine methyltransferase